MSTVFDDDNYFMTLILNEKLLIKASQYSFIFFHNFQDMVRVLIKNIILAFFAFCRYNIMFRFLLNVRRAQAELQSCWKLLVCYDGHFHAFGV